MAEQQKAEFADLSPEQLERIEALEKKLGALVIAYKTPLRPASLSDEQLAALQAAEQAMPGICLVAYKTPPEA